MESELSVEVRARGPSPAERACRNALRAAGFQVAPVTIRVHPSQLLSPGGDKRAAEAAYRNYLAAEPENLIALMGWPLAQHRVAVGEALQIRRQRYAAEGVDWECRTRRSTPWCRFWPPAWGTERHPRFRRLRMSRRCSMSFRAFTIVNR